MTIQCEQCFMTDEMAAKLGQDSAITPSDFASSYGMEVKAGPIIKP